MNSQLKVEARDARTNGRLDPAMLLLQYERVRRFTEFLCRPLAIEDYVVQPMTDASPTKWHLAHTSWFFERFVLNAADPHHEPLHPQYYFLFNSYYQLAGKMHPRPQRGMITRPTVAEVHEYRREVDDLMTRLLQNGSGRTLHEILPIVELGLHHEQQHQELILTDLKYLLSLNPLRPVYGERKPVTGHELPLLWHSFGEGIYAIGHEGESFAYDNEGPRHRVFLNPFKIGSRLVNCGEYMKFIADGGYERSDLWLSDGWIAMREADWRCPLYWERIDGHWQRFTLDGVRPIDPLDPVTHVSFYEADAFARWSGARLPLESEWEVVAASAPVEGNFVEDGHYHPIPPMKPPNGFPAQLFGDVWEWTSSPYTPYPGFHPASGPIGEYNGKFMCNQMVLRGGSCATSRSHIRATYRNFFPPTARWQFSGIRLAQDA
ncbi:ergothioneine biosynthesis protein EgtB [bacterium]|nr:ergothioneine biosynthesis protein EgtB [bacterium]